MANFYTNKQELRTRLRAFIDGAMNNPSSNAGDGRLILSDEEVTLIRAIVIDTGFSMSMLEKELNLYGLSLDLEKKIIFKV